MTMPSRIIGGASGLYSNKGGMPLTHCRGKPIEVARLIAEAFLFITVFRVKVFPKSGLRTVRRTSSPSVTGVSTDRMSVVPV